MVPAAALYIINFCKQGVRKCSWAQSEPDPNHVRLSRDACGIVSVQPQILL